MLCDVAGVNGRQRKAKTSWVVHFIFNISTVFISLSNRLFLWSFGLSAVGAQWTKPAHAVLCVDSSSAFDTVHGRATDSEAD